MIGKIFRRRIGSDSDDNFRQLLWRQLGTTRDGGSNTGRSDGGAAGMRLRTGCGWDRVCNVSPKRGFPVRGDGHLNGLLTQISRSQGIWNIST